MALDKQRILNELGSVVNQLQGADCGCMGKLFSNTNCGQGGAAPSNPPPCGGYGGFGGCRHGCHYGGCYGANNVGHGVGFGPTGAGEPGSNGHCMGHCNPRKIYADTYSYLNQNLMQPTIKEVYDDLKSITPENTVMNHTMAGNMGLPTGGKSMQGGNLRQEQFLHGGNSMQGGNLTQGEFSMHGGSPMQGTNQGDAAMQGHQILGSGSGNQMQREMYGDGMDYQMQKRMQSGAGIPHQMQANANYHMQAEIQGNTGMLQDEMQGSAFGNQITNNQAITQMTNQNMPQMMGGLGPQITKMMQGDPRVKSTVSPQGGQMPGQMLIDAPQSPHGKLGVTPLNAPREINQEQYNINANMSMGMSNSSNQQMHNPTTQYITDPNMNNGFNTYGQNNANVINHNMQQGQANTVAAKTGQSFPATQQMAMANRNYGQHTQGVTKFNEMFPGVMQGGELGFDPMAIAIQMNPENHRRTAMDTMKKIMTGNTLSSSLNTNADSANLKTAIADGNAATSNMFQRNAAPTNQQNISASNQNQYKEDNMNAGLTSVQPGQILQQQVYNANQEARQQVNNQVPQPMYDGSKVSSQPVYNALTGAPTMNQGQPQQLQSQQYQIQQQHMVDPNTGAIVAQNLTPVNEGAPEDANALMEQQPSSNSDQLMIQDPIFPVDTSRFQPPSNMRQPKYYQYNTLGQPVEMLPAKMFQSLPETNLPQTLSPQPVTGKLRNDISRFNVKSTVSKTALMANRPVGKTPSRSQLQNIYNQYKGSQSYTQQNVNPSPPRNPTNSEGKLGVHGGHIDQTRLVPVERVGGDSAANNQAMVNQVPIKGQPVQQMGDVPAPNKPCGDIIPTKELPINQGRCRNGLQDMVYTSYPTSTAWSFHGNVRNSFPSRHQHRNRA